MPEVEPIFELLDYPYAHRGLWGAAVPENSLAAFEAAAKAGVGCELDVRVTRDDRLVVFHDTTLERICGRPERVDELPLSTIKALKLPDGSPIPMIEEALESMAGFPVLIEVKVDQFRDSTHRDRRAVGLVIELLRNSTAKSAVMSFDEPAVWQLAAAAEGVGGPALKQPVGQLIEPLFLLNVDGVQAKASRAKGAGCAFVAPHLTSLVVANEAFGGRMSATWTVRGMAELELARDHGAAPIFEGFSSLLASGLAKGPGTPI